MKLFSKLDLEFIYRSMGRKPNKKELIILHDVLEPILIQRKYLPARFVKQIGLIKNNFHFEILDFKIKKNEIFILAKNNLIFNGKIDYNPN